MDLSVKDETFIKNLGTIQLKLYRVSNMVQQYHSGAGVGGTPVPSDKMIHEKAKKALVSHQTEFVGFPSLSLSFVLLASMTASLSPH